MSDKVRQQAEIVTLTLNPAIDKSSSIENVVPEKKMRCERPSHEPGGGGINVSRAIRKLGGESLALYTHGGPPGQMLQQLLDEEGLTHRGLQTQDWTRENFIAFEKSTTLQYRFGMPGPGLYEEEWNRCLQMIENMDLYEGYFVISGSLPLNVPDDFYAGVIKKLKPRGVKVILDVSGMPLKRAVEEGVYLLKPNLNELEEMTGVSLEDVTKHQSAVMELIDDGKAEVMVVSLGAAGAMVAQKTGVQYWRSPLVPIKSKVGAGDSMVGGIVLSLARGASVDEAVRFGLAAGSAAVMTPGSELCRLEDTERLLEHVVRIPSPEKV